jgi:transglutaminase-like putative cysteine protease
MQIRVGFELVYQFPQPTPVILTLDVHYTRAADILSLDHLATDPPVAVSTYRDGFGNWCSRLMAPPGRIRITNGAVIRDSGNTDAVVSGAWQHTIESLSEEALPFLLGSRYCETDLLSQIAWNLFGQTALGSERVQAICDYVHHHIRFDYQQARSTRTAWGAYRERIGVCRDYAHLAIAFCRCMNIPARYCTGYLGDMGTPLPYPPGDFAAWLEVYLAGEWHMFDPRNNVPRIGRVLIARGRDAADVAIATTFGPNTLESFTVWTDEMSAA